MTIRRATRADLPRLVELLSQLSIEAAREDPTHDYGKAFEAIDADPRQTLMVYETPERGIVGTLVLVIVPNLSYRGRPWGIIENVVVDSAARGGKVGEQLVMHAIELARAAGCFRVGLTSNKLRTDSHRFYERLGFVKSHEGFKYEL